MGIGFDSSGRQKQAKMTPGWSVIGKTESLTKTFNFHSWQPSEFVATELLSLEATCIGSTNVLGYQTVGNRHGAFTEQLRL